MSKVDYKIFNVSSTDFQMEINGKLNIERRQWLVCESIQGL